jgi:osmoprotectant transport system substrate-binding protein
MRSPVRTLRVAGLVAMVTASATILVACTSGTTTSAPAQTSSDVASAGSVAASPIATASTEEQVDPYASVTGPINVGSLEFTSSRIMAELYVRALRAAGYDAQLTVPSTNPVFVPAMEGGRVDVLPAYASLFADFLYIDDNGEDAVRPQTSDVSSTVAAANELAEARGLEMLNATPAAETAAFAVTKEFSDNYGIRTLSQLAEWSGSNPLRMGGEDLCEIRPYCKPNLEKTYGMDIKDYVALSADGAVVKAALLHGGIELGYLVGTDTAAASPDLVVLEQDKPLNIVGNIAPVISTSIATADVVKALNAVTAAVTDEELGAMVAAVQVDGEPVARVTGDFVSANGLGEGLYTGPTKVVSVDVPQEQAPVPTTPVRSGPLRIAYAPLTDTEIAAGVYAAALKAAGIDVLVGDAENPADILAELQSGELQFAPMRLNAITNILNVNANGQLTLPIEGRNVNKMVANARALAKPLGMTILKASTANVSSAWAVSRDFIANTGVKTLSDLARVSQTRPMTVAGPPSCPSENWCKSFLEDKYGVKIVDFEPLDWGGGLTRAAVDTGAVDVGWMEGNDGGLEEFGFTALADDLGRESVNPITPVLHSASLTPEIRKVLDRVSTVLTTDDLKVMNRAIEFDREDLSAVVHRFVREHGLA